MNALRRTGDGRFHSYAQCGEDAVLLRLFSEQTSGFWVDVGANHPEHDSVTKNFSDMGWTGINVEPVASLHATLEAARPNDVNLLAGLSDHEGEMTFYRVDSNFGLSTFDAALAARHEAGGEQVTAITVPILTLAQVCEQHLDGRRIDFLKIDTERHELEVLKGHDFERFPPRVLLAETGDEYSEIVDYVTGQEMRFVQFDGLNCWFVSPDEGDDAFRTLQRPAHRVLDGYHPAIYTDQLEAQHARIVELERQLHARLAGSDGVQTELATQRRTAIGRAVRGAVRRLRSSSGR